MSSTFKIFSPEDCDFYYDGELKGHIIGNSDKSFRFEVKKKGTYRLLFINSQYKSELRKTITIDVDEEQIVDLDFSEVNAEIERLRQIEAEKRKAEKEAERKRIEEDRRKREAEEAERRRRIEAEKREAEETERRRIEAEKRRSEEVEKRRVEEERRKRKAEEAERRRRIEAEKRRAEEAERRRIEEENKRSEAIKMSYEKRVEFVDKQNAAKHYLRINNFGFSEGLSPMENTEGKWGFIDKTGKEIIPYIYDECRKFKAGIAFVKQNNKWGCIDKQGNVLTPFVYSDLDYPSPEGFVYVRGPGGWGILDARGKEVVPCQYRSCSPLWSDRRIVNGFIEVMDDYNHKHGLMNMDGNVIIPCIYDYVGKFSEGLVAVRKGNKTSYLDKTGRVVIKTEEYACRDFSDGLAHTRDGYIDKSGNIIRSKYAVHGCFSEGFAYFENRISRRFGYINTNFDEVISFSTDDYDFTSNVPGHTVNSMIAEFREGLALVVKNRKYGFIDKTGKLVSPCIYDYRWGLKITKQFVYTIKNGKFGCIDKNGKEIIPFIYDSVGEFSEGLACVFRDDKYGFVDITGKEILPLRSLPKLYY